MEKLDASCSDAYVGSLISLTSKSEIRYEGFLFTLDTEKSTIVLKDVRSFGTEGRGTNILHIPPSSKVYDYIIFRNTDIKDLSVVAFSHNSEKPTDDRLEETTPEDLVQNDLSGHCMDICLGWPVSPQPSQMQEGANWWQWLFSSAASGSYGMSPNAVVATFSNSQKKTAPTSSWNSFMQENYDASVKSSHAKLSIFEQVPMFTPRTQSLEVWQHPAAYGTGLMTGHEQPKSSPHSPLQVRPLWQQPLLPLPVSEIEHRRLMREKGLANLQHAKRPRVSSRRRSKRAFSEEDSSSSPSIEASCSLFDLSKDFDFEAMNEHFNKKDLWNHIELDEQQGMHTNGKQHDPPQTNSDSTTSCSLSRKARFVDDFFDLSLSDDGSSTQNKTKGSDIAKQHQIDAETFGVSSLPRRDRRRGLHRGALWGGQHISIRTK
ncbi:hypothetical protein GOP47_0009495 [Adiantum capillus-veneris]|uniref:DFDF domain-containing protein n=1 Tax=Adiantum capillus-veneris TaxID=13818 RepID=A0A9D4UWZ3_ADICA|nr:hypothetical protein GOP47_0009495 [Adiantum capillus-veneris]